MAQYARPDSTIDAGLWTTAPLFSKLQTYPWDDVPATGNFIDSPNNPLGLDTESVKFGVGNVTDPGTNRGHRLRVAWYKQGTSTMRGDVELRQGTTGIAATDTLIATLTNTDVTTVANNCQVDTYLLSEAEAGNITNYNDLSIWIRPNRTSGATSTDLRVRGVELEVPSDSLSRTVPSGVPTDPYTWWSHGSFSQADNTDVENWQDDSGNGRSLQSRASGKPKYIATISEAGDLPGVRFDRTLSTRLAVPLTPSGSPLTAWTTIIVLVPRSFLNSEGTSTPVIFAGDKEYDETALGKTSASHKFSMINEAIAWTCGTPTLPAYMFTQAGAIHVGGGTPVLATRQVVAVKWTGGTDAQLWVDGTMVKECDSSGDHDAYVVQLGCRETIGGDRFATFDCIHFLYYNRILTDQEIIDASTAFLAESAGGGGSSDAIEDIVVKSHLYNKVSLT